ncbi:hypothetical protein H2201_005811 [Coniosporium apollinis]|uniref:Uncharacterized protein n=1 Tax=Coniosporium apollinis TaxID=61459 RepID=A0ABQ9NS35_9PEZI|nr:hypothetical protein H2201_005811 [Coniosporium apollinis]
MSMHSGESEPHTSEATGPLEAVRMPEVGSAAFDTDWERKHTKLLYEAKWANSDDDCFPMARWLLQKVDLPISFKMLPHLILSDGEDKPM